MDFKTIQQLREIYDAASSGYREGKEDYARSLEPEPPAYGGVPQDTESPMAKAKAEAESPQIQQSLAFNRLARQAMSQEAARERLRLTRGVPFDAERAAIVNAGQPPGTMEQALGESSFNLVTEDPTSTGMALAKAEAEDPETQKLLNDRFAARQAKASSPFKDPREIMLAQRTAPKQRTLSISKPPNSRNPKRK